MTLPASGLITQAMINTELGKASNAAITLNDAAVRTLLGKSSGAISLADGYGKSAKVYATWDPANKTAGAVTLSNGNLTASISGNNYAGVRSTISKTAGKWYWEITVGSPASLSIGDFASNDSVDNWLGNGSWSTGYDSSGGCTRSPAVYVGSNAGFTTGDVIGVCLDAATGAITFRKNNVAQPYGYTMGTFTWFAGISSYFGTGVSTANFGATPLVYTPPAGYNPGLYN